MGFVLGNNSGKTKKNQEIEPVTYVCDNCGTKVTSLNGINRCLGCGKALCDICNNYMLCAQDYQLLNKKDKKKVKRLGTSLQSISDGKSIMMGMSYVLGIVGIVLLILMIILQRDLFYFLFGFLGGFLLLAAVMMFGMFRNMDVREKKRVTMNIRDIVLKYNNITPINRESTGKVESKIIEGNVISGKDGIILCKSCGAEIRSKDMKFCEICGFQLRE